MALSQDLVNRLRVALCSQGAANELQTALDDLTDGTISTTTLTVDGAVTVNEAGAAAGDFRVESDTNTTFVNTDADGMVGGQFSIGAAPPTNPQALVAILPPARATGVTANQSYYHMTMLPGGATVIPTGTAPIAATLNVAEPNLTATGTITDAATVRIADAPTEGGTGNYALWVDAGLTRMDGSATLGALVLGGAAPTNPQAFFAVVPPANASGVTAGQSYFHGQILPGGAVTIPSGTAPVVASLNIHEPNITATGTVTAAASLRIVDAPTEGSSNYALWVDAGVTRLDGNLDMADAALDVLVKANTAAALEVYDATTKILAVDTRNTVKDVHAVTITGVPVTVASEAAAHLNSSLNIAAKTITYTGTTGTTSSLGAMLNIGVPTFTDADTMTLTTASSVHINAVAAAGGSLTISNSHMISTSVSDAFLTNAGVWTDTACWAWGKNLVVDATTSAIQSIINKLTPKAWTYKDDVHGDDRGRERVGIVYDELPEELRAPGQEKGVSAGVLSSFALAAIRMLFDENRSLKTRLEALEAA